jgi:cytochrome b involved in lipid metabolism
MDNHPGGRFSLDHNIGKDVSKFFYGGYSMENESGLAPHTHSNDARKALNTLVFATFRDNVKV